MAEASFIASSRSKIHKLKKQGNKKAKLLDKNMEEKDAIISVVLFANNAVNIVASSVATIIAIEFVPKQSWIYEYSPFVSSVILTVIVVIFAEIIPKTIAINNPELISIRLSFFYNTLKKFLGPFLFIINKFTFSILQFFNVHRPNTEKVFDTLRGEIEYHHMQGNFIKHDKDMLEGVLNLVEMDVESVMTHRKDCDMIDINSSIEEITQIIDETSHTRIPVYDDTPDEMLGILHLKDFVVLLNSRQAISKETIKSILLKPLFVPLNIKLKTQLMEFKKNRSRMAIVVDEYGGMMGVVTLSDILEEIVGTIEDEHDDSQKNIIEEKPNTWIVNGECQIGDFNREIGSSFNQEKASTMAGIVIEKAGKIPEEGEEFNIMGFTFLILQKDISKISLLRIEKIDQPTEDH